MPTHTLARKDSSQHAPAPGPPAQQAFAKPGAIVSRKGSPNMPTVGEDSDNSGGATAKAEALYAPVQPPQVPAPEAAGAADKPESSAAPSPAQGAEPSAGAAAVSEAAKPPLPHVPSGAPPACVSAGSTFSSDHPGARCKVAACICQPW